jgi:hypothetical protein
LYNQTRVYLSLTTPLGNDYYFFFSTAVALHSSFLFFYSFEIDDLIFGGLLNSSYYILYTPGAILSRNNAVLNE